VEKRNNKRPPLEPASPPAVREGSKSYSPQIRKKQLIAPSREEYGRKKKRNGTRRKERKPSPKSHENFSKGGRVRTSPKAP